MNTPEENIYLLDTSILFDLSLWHPMSLSKNFWLKIEEALQNGKWILLDVVVGEVRGDNDGLKKWCEEQKKKGLVQAINDTHRNRGVEINNSYKMIDETTLRSTIDTYLVAYAEENKLTIFSRESPRKKEEDPYKIPDVCKMLSIRMIRRPREFFEAIGYKG